MIKKILTILTTLIFLITIFTPIVIGNAKNLSFEKDISPLGNDLPNIMLTGYWNPTGQMIAPFSTDPYLNPDGWIGENWEDRGYDIYSFFPTPGSYNGTFEVDYQKTWEDFWNITDLIKPIAIISFGAGAGPWEIEYNARNLDSWVNDYNPPYQPTPCPPDDTVPINHIRHSTLPVQEIEDAVNENTSVNAWVDWNGNPGAFLCEYMAYLGMWYQSIHHNDSTDPCQSAGFIHVTSTVPVEDAMEAVKVTIRVIINNFYFDNYPPEAPSIDGPANGIIDIPYNFTFNSIDPEDEDVYYYIIWGDGHVENWDGPHLSGVDFEIEHTYTKTGTFKIEVKAKDTNGYESIWNSLEISIPRNKVCIKNYNLLNIIFHRFPILYSILTNCEILN
jgi:pyrrolidone-carboxylate peptidase